MTGALRGWKVLISAASRRSALIQMLPCWDTSISISFFPSFPESVIAHLTHYCGTDPCSLRYRERCRRCRRKPGARICSRHGSSRNCVFTGTNAVVAASASLRLGPWCRHGVSLPLRPARQIFEPRTALCCKMFMRWARSVFFFPLRGQKVPFWPQGAQLWKLRGGGVLMFFSDLLFIW